MNVLHILFKTRPFCAENIIWWSYKAHHRVIKISFFKFIKLLFLIFWVRFWKEHQLLCFELDTFTFADKVLGQQSIKNQLRNIFLTLLGLELLING